MCLKSDGLAWQGLIWRRFRPRTHIRGFGTQETDRHSREEAKKSEDSLVLTRHFAGCGRRQASGQTMTARPPVKRLPFEPDGESGRNRGLMGGGQLGAARSTGNSLPLVRIRASEDLAIATAN